MVIVEVVEYSLVAGVTDETYKAAQQKAKDEFLSKQPGFISWEVYKGDGSMLDVVKWESKEHADNAQNEFRAQMESDALKDFVAAADHESISMRYFELLG